MIILLHQLALTRIRNRSPKLTARRVYADAIETDDPKLLTDFGLCGFDQQVKVCVGSPQPCCWPNTLESSPPGTATCQFSLTTVNVLMTPRCNLTAIAVAGHSAA